MGVLILSFTLGLWERLMTVTPPNGAQTKRRYVGRVVVLTLALGLSGAVGAVVGLHRRKLEPVRPLRASTAMIVPGLYVLGDVGPSVVYVIDTPDGLVLIDAALEEDAQPLKTEMRRLGLDWRRIRAILLTHAHGDHTGGAQQLRALTGARVHAGRADAGVLRAGEPREAFFSNFPMPNHVPHATTVDVELAGDERLTFGNVMIRPLALPGHTPGSVCYLMERDGLRVLFGGDVISCLAGEPSIHSDERDPLGTYSVYLPPRYRGNAADYLASLRRLRDLAAPDLLLPGHPGSDPTPQSPQLSTERWQSMLDRGIHALESLVARYQSDGADFLDDGPKALLPGLYYLGNFHGFAAYGLVAQSRFIAVGSVPKAGFDDFVRSRQTALGLELKTPAAILLTGCTADAIGGLADFLPRTHAEVIGPDTGLGAIKHACPPGTVVTPASALGQKDWFPVTPLALPGWGQPTVAYVVDWAGKSVLFSDEIPLLFHHDRREDTLAARTRSRTATLDYLVTGERLLAVTPDLWLPAQPYDGQNANLYDHEWKHILDNNLMAGAYRLGQQ